jgi:SHS2 domain-containing protein
MKKGFKFLEHTADVYIEVYGFNLEEAFANAALSMTEVMTKLENVEAKNKENFVIEAHDKSALLYNWLEELLLEFELKSKLYSRIEVSKIEKTANGFKLYAKAWGEKFDLKKHPSKVGIKAITYHQMEIIQKSNSVILRFILDI